MKKQLSKFNYIIMFLVVIVLTSTIFLIAFLVSNNGNQSEMEFETVISTNDDNPNNKNANLFSNAISQSNGLDGSREFDIETVEVGESGEIDYDFPDEEDFPDEDEHDIASSSDGLNIYHRPYDEDDLEEDDDDDTVIIDDDEEEDDDTDIVDVGDDEEEEDEEEEEPREEYLHNKSGDILLFEEGRDYYIDDYYDEALKTLRKMIRLYPTSPYVSLSEIYIGKSLIGRGMETNDRNDFIRSNDLLEDDLDEFANSPNDKNLTYIEELVDFIAVLSESNRNLGIPNQEIESNLENILSLVSSEKAKEHINTSLGYLKMFREDYDNAVNSFKESDTDLAQLGLSRAYLKLGMFDEALKIWLDFIANKKISYYYPDAVKLFKEHTIDHARGLFNDNKYTSSIRYYTIIDNYLNNTEEEEEALYFKGVALFNIQQYDKALSSFRDVLRNRVTSRDSYAEFYRGKTRIQIGRSYDEVIDKINMFELALSNLVEFTERYPQHSLKTEANALIEYLRKQIVNLQA